MAGVTGLEPAASGVTGRRSNRLSYTPIRPRPREIETGPSQVKRRRRIPGLNLGRRGDATTRPVVPAIDGDLCNGVVGDEGFEPPTLSV